MIGYKTIPQYAMLSADDVKERTEDLRRLWSTRLTDRTRIRAILNGGRPAIEALFGADTRFRDQDLPAANFVDSGLERLAQKVGHLPDVKVHPPLGEDGPRKRYNYDVLEQITAGLDHMQRLELQLPQQARWLPGYGFCVWVIDQRQDPLSGYWYPVGRIYNSYDCYPSGWDADDDPEELAVVQIVSAKKLARQYPAFANAYTPKGGNGGIFYPGFGLSAWGNAHPDGVVVVKYYDISGCYVWCEETNQLLDYWPNVTELPPFVVTRRFTFDQLQGQYHHVIGLQAMIAKLNILAYIAAEDGVFREMHVIGDMSQKQINRGRFGVNFWPQGTQISKLPIDPSINQAWQQIDRLERSLRVGANYPQTADAESPQSFATGQGLDRLVLSFVDNVAEYQKAMKWGLQKMDALRLCWDEALYSGLEKPMYSMVGGQVKHGTYDPARIKGWYNTRRVYGMMASWDEPQKIVGGLQLLSAGVIDVETMQENLYGLENLSRINERVLRRQVAEFMFQSLAAVAQANDPRAMLALVEIFNEPRNVDTILKEHFTPQEPQESPATQQFLGGPPGGAVPGELTGEAPPDVATILSRLEASGEIGGGSQTVARV